MPAILRIGKFFELTSGVPVATGTAAVYARGTTTPVTLYTDATGGTTTPNPTTITNGRVSAYVPEGSYDVVPTVGGVTYAVDPLEAVAGSEVATLDGQVSTLNTEVSTLLGQVSTLNAEVATLNSEYIGIFGSPHTYTANQTFGNVIAQDVAIGSSTTTNPLQVLGGTLSTIDFQLTGVPTGVAAQRSRIFVSSGATAIENVDDAYTTSYTALSISKGTTPTVTIPNQLTVGGPLFTTSGNIVAFGSMGIYSASGGPGSDGSPLVLTAGNAGSGNQTGGHAYLRPGAASGTGSVGMVHIADTLGNVQIAAAGGTTTFGNGSTGVGSVIVYGTGLNVQGVTGQDANLSVACGSGGHVSQVIFRDGTGGSTPIWSVQKSNDNSFRIYHIADSREMLRLTTGAFSSFYIGPTGDSHTITNINYAPGTEPGGTPPAPVNVNGNVLVSGNVYAAAYPGPSDKRIKENIEPLDPSAALESVLRLNPVEFDHLRLDGRHMAGLIAQEVQEVIPDAVVECPDPLPGSEAGATLLGLDYPTIVAHLIATIQHLEGRVAKLEASVAPEHVA